MDWSAPVVAAVVAALLCAVAGLAVPRIIARLPEPAAPEPPPGDPDSSVATSDSSVARSDSSAAIGDSSAAIRDSSAGMGESSAGMGESSGGMEEEPKELYAEIARLPGLAWRSAVASAAIGALLAFSVGWSWTLVFLLPLVPVGVALSVVDWRTKLLPVRIIYPTTAGVIVLGAAVGFLTPEPNHFWRALLGAVIARSAFWLLWFIRSAGMGFGDVRLAAIIGFVLAWFGWAHLFIGLWVGFLAFGVPGLLLAVFRRDRGVMRRAYPFGPFLLGGAVVGVVWGAQLGLRLVGG